MGIYVNPGNEAFRVCRNGVYVDKSGLISVVNSTIDTRQKLSCVSRARRFGKSFAAKMLCAYFDCSCDSSELFDDLVIADDSDYRKHLNGYNVLCLDLTQIMATNYEKEPIASYITRIVGDDMGKVYPDISVGNTLNDTLLAAVEQSGKKFVAVIDEWDAPIRDSDSTPALQKAYLEFLRSLFKNTATTDKIFAAAYMTGILPIKKDGSQSAISEFREYTMLAPEQFEPYFGFNKDEVEALCKGHGVDFGQMKSWYDGYSFSKIKSVYNPNSVMYAIDTGKFKSYWQMSAAADSLLTYINMDFDGLGNAAVDLLAGSVLEIETMHFKNDLDSLESRDDVLTLLIHFGYLNYDEEGGTVRIPNEEIRMEFARTIRDVKHAKTIKRVKESEKLLNDTILMDEEAVAAAIEKVHMEECAPIHYNGEQALRSVIKMAYFTYRDYYIRLEELPSGKGYADIVYLPKRHSDLPALVIELKNDDAAETAIEQIKARNYPDVIKDFGGDVLLVGISYEKKDRDKKHRCVIEEIEC